MRFRLNILYFIFFLLPLAIQAQELDPTYYDYPLRDVAGYYSSNFGEMRSNHFHSGVDFKTDGVEGKPVVAVADGYVSRIFQSPSGYGLALYITHPNGTTSVYGHLSRFRADIAKYVFQERHRQRKHRVDLYCKPEQFPVKRGEEIARSGNSGSSGGPHLHFEIRRTASQKTLNIIAAGVITPKDDIRPMIRKLHYFEVDTVDGVARQSRAQSYEVRRSEGAMYVLTQGSTIKVGRNGYFVVEVTDRKNDTQNTYGVYHIVASIDDEPFFEYRNDGFTFDITRYCNAVAYYPIQRSSRNEAIRLAHQRGSIKHFYPTLVDNGAIRVSAGEKRSIRITATDDCLNTSTLEFDIVGKADEECFTSDKRATAATAHYNRPFSAEFDNRLKVEIPAGALYESTDIELRKADIAIKADSSIVLLSEAYTVGSKNIPLHKSMSVTLNHFVENKALEARTALATVNDKGTLTYAGGKYHEGRVRLNTRSFGTFCIVADATAPTITPQFVEGADCTSRRTISFRLKDNFSGVASYTATIDDRWVAIDFSRGKASINLADEGITGGVVHKIKFVATDSCGNRTEWQGSIKR